MVMRVRVTYNLELFVNILKLNSHEQKGFVKTITPLLRYYYVNERNAMFERFCTHVRTVRESKIKGLYFNSCILTNSCLELSACVNKLFLLQNNALYAMFLSFLIAFVAWKSNLPCRYFICLKYVCHQSGPTLANVNYQKMTTCSKL